MKRISIFTAISFILGAIFFWLFFGSGGKVGTVYAYQPQLKAPPANMSKYSFAPLVKSVRSAVVKVMPQILTHEQFNSGHSLLDRFFNTPSRKQEVTGIGSGFLISSDGYIVTNNHVVENAFKVSVKLIDDREFKANIVGKDSKTDLALLKIDGENLPYIKWGDSESVKVGEWVLAIGNPLNQDLSVTSGIISAKGRQLGVAEYVDFLQTDAAINQGNSGGPLINMRGRVIGINSVILSQSGGNIGIGFAIPSNMAQQIIGDLKSKGSVTRGWLGVGIQSYSKKNAKEIDLPMAGAMIMRVESNSPAEIAGLKKYDFIIKINGKRIKSGTDVQRVIGNSKPGSTVQVEVIRSRKNDRITKEVVIGKAPDTIKYRPAGKSDKILDLGMVVINNSLALKSEYQLTTSKGVLIKSIEQGGFVARYGLKQGDIIFGINRTEIESVSDLREILKESAPGRVIRVWINRRGYETSVRIQLPE